MGSVPAFCSFPLSFKIWANKERLYVFDTDRTLGAGIGSLPGMNYVVISDANSGDAKETSFRSALSFRTVSKCEVSLPSINFSLLTSLR